MERSVVSIKYLVMTFNNADGKSTSISLKYIKDNLTKADVDVCMDSIISFLQLGEILLQSIKLKS